MLLLIFMKGDNVFLTTLNAFKLIRKPNIVFKDEIKKS